MATIKTSGGTERYHKDWGSGEPIVFSRGWPSVRTTGMRR